MISMSRTAKQPDEFPPARHNRTETVGRDATTLAAKAFARAGFADPTLVLRWADIVGPDVARITRPLRLNEGPSGGVLTLKAEPAAATFLQHETRGLCARINAYLGRSAVQRLRFVQGSLVGVPAPKAGPRTSPEAGPDDPSRCFQGPERLRTALLELARTRRKPSVDQAD
jgi:hypothetical protein